MARILMVETDKLIADNLSCYLEKSGHQVDWQLDLQAAINSADRQRPDLVLLDLMLCGRSGVEFLYEFRSYPDWQNVPVVLFSNISIRDLGTSTSGFNELNISAYHYKPTTSLAQLAHSIDFVVDNPVHA
jgi:DNA-binding response OmpR family regulator